MKMETKHKTIVKERDALKLKVIFLINSRKKLIGKG